MYLYYHSHLLLTLKHIFLVLKGGLLEFKVLLRCSVALPLYHPPSFKWKGLILYFAYSDAIPLHNAEQLKLRTAC